jgi:hypothetical protein
LASKRGDVKTVALLIEKGASCHALTTNNQTPRYTGLLNCGNSKTIELLIEKGASVNALTIDNQNPLHWAAQKRNSENS